MLAKPLVAFAAASSTSVAHVSGWPTQFETLLEDSDAAERHEIAAVLCGLVEQTKRGQVPDGGVLGNTFHVPLAFQVGDRNRQDDRFGPEK